MAERRMFAKTIIDSDAFLDMPLSAQALYFHLAMRADDEGFVNNPRKIMRMIGASDDDAKILIGKKFLIVFESGVVVIKHWRIHNYIRKDRLNDTNYQEERALLSVKSNGAYTLNDGQLTDTCQSDDSQMSAQVSIGKDRLGKVSTERRTFVPPTLDEVKAYCSERNNDVDPEKWHNHYEAVGWKVGKNPMKDWKAAVRKWETKKEVREYGEFTW